MRALALLLVLGLPLAAQAPKPEATAPEKKETKAVEEKPVETHHTWKAGSRALAYTATTGFMPLKNEKD